MFLLFACITERPVPATPASAAKVATPGSTLSVTVSGKNAASVSLVQYTFDATNYAEYPTYDTAAVSGSKASFTLDTAPSTEQRSQGGGTVVLGILLLDASGRVIGVGDDVVGWYPTPPSGASKAGWLVGRDQIMSTAVPTYVALDKGTKVDDDIEGDATLEVTGTTALSDATARVTAVPLDASAPEPADADATGRWTLSLGTPDPSTLSRWKHVEVAYFPLEVYGDSDGDHQWDRGVELDIGTVCHTPQAAVLRWIEPPDDLAGAASLHARGLTWGWSTGVLSGYDLSIVFASSFRIETAC